MRFGTVFETINPHRGWSLVHEDYFDSDDIRSDWWEAHHEDGRHLILHVTPYGFRWTQDIFNWMVDHDFPHSPRGNWQRDEIDKKIAHASSS